MAAKKAKKKSSSASRRPSDVAKPPKSSKALLGDRLYHMYKRGTYVDKVGGKTAETRYGLLFDTGIPGADHAIVAEDARGLSGFTVFRSAAEARKMFDLIEKAVKGTKHGHEEIGKTTRR